MCVAKTLSAHEWQAQKIFSSDFQFSIPQYQRPYRWGVDQATQLLDDLSSSMDRGGDDPYFLGSLVLVEDDNVGHFEVIDGQQRLTTLTILFAVLRDLTSGDYAEALSDLVLEPGKVLAGVGARPRLKLRAQEAPFFETYIQQPGRVDDLLLLADVSANTEPKRSIRDNARALVKVVESWSAERREEFARFVSSRTYLVVVSTPDLDSAYRIFSVMNARGLDLSPADIFKSRVIGELDEDSAEPRQWEALEESLGSDGFVDLFRDIRTIQSGERARRELLREFPEQVLDAYLLDGPSGARAFVNDLLLPYGDAFARTTRFNENASHDWVPVNMWLRRLQALDNLDWRPAALWALRHHQDDANYLDAFLRKLERLSASMLLRGEYTTPRVARHLELLNQLKRGEGLEATAFDLDEEERRLTREALNGDIYRMQSRRARYVLLRLDELLANAPGVSYAHNVISIEHVLPQNPSLGSQWDRDFTEEARATWVHRLANLVLLNRRKNSQASNYDFADKKQRYFLVGDGAGTFAITAQVLTHETWTTDTLVERQTRLASALEREWSLV